MFVFPAAFVFAELLIFKSNSETMFLIGKWFVFWAVGVRLFLAGLRQSLTPRFTAEQIFGIDDKKSLIVVRELGFANLAMGVLGLGVILRNSWIMPAAVAGGLFYGFAGFVHLTKKDNNRLEQLAMISDLWIFAILLVYFVASVSHICTECLTVEISRLTSFWT